MERASFDFVATFDSTSNPEHNKDDLGTTMSRVMVLAQPNEERGDDLPRVWRFALAQLAHQRDRLRHEGIVL